MVLMVSITTGPGAVTRGAETPAPLTRRWPSPQIGVPPTRLTTTATPQSRFVPPDGVEGDISPGVHFGTGSDCALRIAD